MVLLREQPEETAAWHQSEQASEGAPEEGEPGPQKLGSPILAALVATPGQVRNHEGSTGPTRI